MSEHKLFSLSAAEQLIVEALVANRVSTANASSVARALVAAEASGQEGHGFSRVGSYALQARSGKVDGMAEPRTSKIAQAWVAVDAANGFAFPAIEVAIAALAALVPDTGVACATVHRSHHCGALGAHVEALAQQGLVALMLSNAPAAMAAFGGKRPLFGTNPIAFAAPREAGRPLVIDLSLSKVARGKVMAAAKAGQTIPRGWALDSEGHPTISAEAALKGTMMPAGGAKGAILALMVEILAAGLSGANYSFEATSFFDAKGRPPGVGHTLIAFMPRVLNGRLFAERIEVLMQAMLDESGVRLPGARRAQRLAMAQEQGLAMPAHLYAEILTLQQTGDSNDPA